MAVEYADSRSVGLDALERSLSHQNPAIVRAVNARRRELGLPEVRTAGDPRAPLRRSTAARAVVSNAAADDRMRVKLLQVRAGNRADTLKEILAASRRKS
jgi:hypothetical protein